MAEVTAVIPTWNQRELLVRLLRDLGRQTRPPMEVIVVDNGSMDDSVAAASRHGAGTVPGSYHWAAMSASAPRSIAGSGKAAETGWPS